MIVRAALDTLARVLGCRDDQAEDVMRSEQSARASFTRRGLFRAAGAVAAGTVFLDELPAPWTYDIRSVQMFGYVTAIDRKRGIITVEHRTVATDVHLIGGRSFEIGIGESIAWSSRDGLELDGK